jgi:hypothetical protein
MGATFHGVYELYYVLAMWGSKLPVITNLRHFIQIYLLVATRQICYVVQSIILMSKRGFKR